MTKIIGKPGETPPAGQGGIAALSEKGLRVALKVREDYRMKQPICLPGDPNRILMPENLLNASLDLEGFDDPLPLAMMATRDPESPMALAAATRLGPLGGRAKLVEGVFTIVGETTHHPLVKKCVNLISENDFHPKAIQAVARHAAGHIARTRQEYTIALRQILYGLMEGVVPPRDFVHQFFELTEAGNLRNGIRKKLVLSLLLSEAIRPSIKFLVLENFSRLSAPVRRSIVSEVLQAQPTHHVEIIKDELKWMLSQEQQMSGNRDVH